MAGLGARLVPAFSKLTSAQVNGYLMDQSIMRFASAAVRDAAFGGAGEPTLAEGMTCYLDDLNVLQSYTGSAWVTIVNTERPAGLELVTSCTATFTSGTAGSVSNGVVTIGTGNTLVTVSNAFSATYDNYLITVGGGVSSVSADNLGLQMGSTLTGYRSSISGANTSSAFAGGYDNNTNQRWIWAGAINVQGVHARIELANPFLALNTYMQSQMIRTGANGHWVSFGTLENTTSYTSFVIQPASGTLTGGKICVYGYRNS
jgi:hypothetical protein